MDQRDLGNRKGLGTFAGVFTPSILTILGIILFLRMGYVVGRSGLAQALVIIAAANLISVLTSFSLAAVATNMRVRGGGDYYLISRTLGLEFGGAIGIVLFLAQSVSIAFYCIGFGEAVAVLAGNRLPWLSASGIAFCALGFLFVLAWLGADLATKFQFAVMACLVAALASFYIGGWEKWAFQNLAANWGAPEGAGGFWPMFALFFPAVTGFTQGVSMSGDLKDPGQSLPLGTFAAVGLSLVVYFSVALVFAGASSLTALARDYGVMKQTAFFGPLIDAGVIAATLSSAMASFLGAPRILQSLASDRIFPFLAPFAKGDGPTGNPRRGVLLSLAIAAITIALGQLDLIAGIVTMFFLISYGLLNYATYFEAAAQSPSFRPRFKWYDRRLSMAGALACGGAMLAIDLRTGIAALAVMAAVYQYLKQTSGLSRWADSRRSYHLKQVRDNLLAADEDPGHPREWRPFIIVMARDTDRMGALMGLAHLMEGNSGITTGVRMVRGSGYRGRKMAADALAALKADAAEHGWKAFLKTVSALDVQSGLPVMLQAFGIGPVRANTVILDLGEASPLMPDDRDGNPLPGAGALLADIHRCGCNLLLARPEGADQPDPGDAPKLIDVWWTGDDTSRLMLLLAYLITRNEGWKTARIRMMAARLDQNSEENMAALRSILEDIRIDAEPRIVVAADEHAIVRESGRTDLVFLPFSLKKGQPRVLGAFPADQAVAGFRCVVLAMAGEKIDLDAAPEEGRAAELAGLLDEFHQAEKRVALAERTASEAAGAARKKMEQIYTQGLFADKGMLNGLKEALNARQEADAAQQKVLRERGKLAAVTEKALSEGLGNSVDKAGSTHVDSGDK